MLENLYRDTKYELFTIGAVDPQNKHIWGFQSSSERETFLTKHLSKTVTDCKFYRVGQPIRINATDNSGFSFENSWKFDYVRITNRPGTSQEKIYYAFIVDRQYININLTELTIAVDWIQTFYFNSSAPFWNVSGYGVSTTNLAYKPIRGMGSEYPVTARRNLWRSKTNNDDLCYIVYSTIDISANFTVGSDYEFLTYVNPFIDNPYIESDFTDNVYMGAVPYIINSGSTLTNLYALIRLNKDLNAYGQIGSITGIYVLPRELAPTPTTNNDAINEIDRNAVMKTITVNVPSAASLFSAAGLSVQNDILQGFGYTYISVSNQQGEEQIFTYEDFTSSTPVFKITATFSTGYPVLICYPENYKFGTAAQPELFAMKQTSPPQCSLNSDNYAIWQAQNRNSIAASIDAGKLSVANAKEAQQKTGGISTLLDSFFDSASENVSDMVSQMGLSVPDGLSDALTTAGYSGLNSILKMGMLGSFGLEASYVYKQQVAVAEQALKGIEAGFADQAYTPATASGSNAFGDLMRLKQFGFQISVIAPDNDALTDLDRINESAGHICKGLISCSRSRTIFDYYRMLEAKIVNNPNIRPQFVNALLTQLFADGVYFWWIQSNGDVDISNFGHPYAVTNTPI